MNENLMEKCILEAAQEKYYLDKNNTITLYADRYDTNEFLLQTAYDNRDSEDLMNILHDEIYEAYMHAILDTEDEIVELATKKYLDECTETEKNEFDEDVLRETLRETISIDPDYDHFLDQKFKVNIMISFPEERNHEYTMNNELYESFNNIAYNCEDYSECGIGWLIKQQGHSFEELEKILREYDYVDLLDDEAMKEFKKTHNKFLTSIYDEYSGQLYDMNVLTVLAEVDLNEYVEINKPDKEIVIPKNADIGLFNPWNGSGAMLEIELEKDLVINTDDIDRIQIDERCVRVNNKEYTVDETYGLLRSCWRPIKEIRDAKTPLIDVVKKCEDISKEKNESLHSDSVNKEQHINLESNRKDVER